MSDAIKIVIPSALKSNAVAVSLVQLAYSIAALEVPQFAPSEAVACLRKAGLDDHADKLESVERAEWEKTNGDEGSKTIRQALNDGFDNVLKENGLKRLGGGRPSLPTCEDLSQTQREAILKDIKAGTATVDGIAAAYTVSKSSVVAFAKSRKLEIV